MGAGRYIYSSMYSMTQHVICRSCTIFRLCCLWWLGFDFAAEGDGRRFGEPGKPAKRFAVLLL